MVRLILVRHGVTEWNQAGRYQGHQDVPLSDLGREQARLAAERLRAEPITLAYSSDLQRARETARIILGEREVELRETEALREMAFGAWEGLTAAEVAARFPVEWAAWIRDPVASRPPGGEDMNAFGARITSFYGSLAPETGAVDGQPDWFSYRASGQTSDSTSETVLLVSHGGTVRALLAHLFEVRIELYWRFGIRPASVSIFDVYPQGAVAEVIGETSHLQVPGSESRILSHQRETRNPERGTRP